MADIRVRIINEVVGASEIDKQIVREQVLKAETEKLGAAHLQLGQRMTLTREESQKLGEIMRLQGSSMSDAKAVTAALGLVMGTTATETAKIGTALKNAVPAIDEANRGFGNLAAVDRMLSRGGGLFGEALKSFPSTMRSSGMAVEESSRSFGNMTKVADQMVKKLSGEELKSLPSVMQAAKAGAEETERAFGNLAKVGELMSVKLVGGALKDFPSVGHAVESAAATMTHSLYETERAFSRVIIGGREVNRVMGETRGPLVDVGQMFSGLGTIATKVGGVFQGLWNTTSGLNKALTGMGQGGGGGGGGPLGFLTGAIGPLTTALGALPLPALIPVLAAVIVGVVALGSSLWAVVLAFAAMAVALTVAIGLLAVFAGAALGAFGLLGLAILPILGIAVALGVMSQAQAKASQTATAGMVSATAAYKSAQQALATAQQGSPALANAQSAAGITAQQLQVAQMNVAARPTSIGAQGALSAAQIANQNAQQTLLQQQAAQTKALAAAQQTLQTATTNLAKAQQAVAQSSGVQTGAFDGLVAAMGKMTQEWVANALPALTQINDWLVNKILPAVDKLAEGVIYWFNQVIGPTIKSLQPAFDILFGQMGRAGGIFADFFSKMLARAPALTDIFKEFGKGGLAAFQGLLDNGIRLVDWFTSPDGFVKMRPIIDEILGGIGTAVQGGLSGIATFVTWVSTNWPTIAPVFQATVAAIGQFFTDLMKPDSGLARLMLWLEKDFPKAYQEARGFLDSFGKDISKIGDFLNGLGQFINNAKDAWKAFWDFVAPILVSFKSGFDDSFKNFKPMLDQLTQAVGSLNASLGAPGSGGLLDALKFLAYWLGQLAGLALGGLLTSLFGLVEGLLKTAQAIEAIVRAIQEAAKVTGAAGLIKQITGVDILGGGGSNEFGGASGGGGGPAPIGRHQTGGLIMGPGGIDNILARVTAGEGIVSVPGMSRLGVAGLNAINSGTGLSGGGGGLARVEALLQQLISQRGGSGLVVNATAIDHRALAVEISKHQQFSLAAGRA
jgi:hypothetical protein